MLHLICPFGDAIHVGCFHAGGVMLATAIGAALGPVVLERWVRRD